MTIQHVASHGVAAPTGSQPSATFTGVRPPGVAVQNGDVIIAFVRHQSSLSKVDASSPGFTRISMPFLPEDIQARTSGIFMRRVTDAANEPESYPWAVDSVATGRYAVVTSIFRSSNGSVIEPGVYTPSYSGLSVTNGRAVGQVSSTKSGQQIAFWASEFSSNQDHEFVTPPNSFAMLGKAVSHNGVVTVSRTALWAGRRAVAAGTIPSNAGVWGAANGAVAQAVVLYEVGGVEPGTAVGVVENGVEVQHHATWWDGTEEKPVSQIMALPHRGYSITQMEADIAAGKDVFWAHRGGSLNWPEMTLRAFTNAIWHGAKVLESSYVRTKDGVWVAQHDADFTRATGQNPGLAKDINASEVLGLPVIVPNSAPDAVVERLELLLDTYPQFVLLLDHKTGTDYQGWMNLIKSRVPNWQDQVILKIAGASGPTRFQEAKDGGFKTAAYFYPEDSEAMITERMPFVDYPGMSSSASQEVWNFITSFGKPVWGHVLQTMNGYNESKAKGAKIFQCANVSAIIPRINEI